MVIPINTGTVRYYLESLFNTFLDAAFAGITKG